MKEKLVSVIIPAFNAEKFLKETVQCVLNQTHKNLEILVINDGSTDGTLNKLNEFEDERLIIISQTNSGVSRAKQTGLDMCKGDYIQYLDADDIISEDKIERQVESLTDSDKVAVCKTAHFFNGDNYNERNIPGDDYFFQEHLNDPLKFLINLYGGFNGRAGMIQPNAFLIPKEVSNKAGGWDTSFSPCPDEDGEYFCRIILNSSGIVYSPTIMNYYRKFIKKNSLSGLKTELSLSNLFKSIWLKHQHLTTFCKEPSLIKHIHSATFRQIDELKKRVYPQYMNLYHLIEDHQKELKPGYVEKHRVYGGKLTNFIGNHISWKLIRRLQYYKDSMN